MALVLLQARPEASKAQAGAHCFFLLYCTAAALAPLPWSWAAVPPSMFSSALTLLVRYPASQLKGGRLYLRGDGCGLSWDSGILLNSSGLDTWTLALPSGCPATLEFKALIDDSHWAVGANAVLAAINYTYTPWFSSQAGRYEVVATSRGMRDPYERDTVVWVPPSFDENPYAFYGRVLLMQDGENVFDDKTAFGGRSWRAGTTLDAEVSSGRVAEMLVAAPDNSAHRIDEYTWTADPQYGGGDADGYLDWLQAAVLPQLRRKYRLAPSAEVSIGGSSLGGLLSSLDQP